MKRFDPLIPTIVSLVGHSFLAGTSFQRRLSLSKLILISVPIGNLEDITYRACRVLKEKTTFFVEDTRSFKSLLRHLEIGIEGKRVDSFHDHSASHKVDRILEYLKQGEDICLVSEAGSPIISDPAYPLIKRALEQGCEIESVPGVSSPIVGLELSGLPPQPFHFHAFLARGDRDRFDCIKSVEGTHIFFEAPGRVRKTLSELCAQLPTSKIVVARELTKKFETVYRFGGGECSEILDQITYKGEFVILVNVASVEGGARVDERMRELAEGYVEGERSPKVLAKILAGLTGRAVKEIYKSLVS